MTEATQATEGTGASTPAVDGGATAAPESGQQQQATEGQQTAEQKTEQQPQIPESYEFKAPEGVEVLDGATEAYAEVAKELKLTQEQAQAAFEKLAAKGQANQLARVEAMRSEWAASATSDAEFGGEKLQENLSVAKKALDTFGTPELKKLLNESGLGNHPEIIRAFYRAGKATSEDGFVAGGNVHQASPKSIAQQMYPDMNP